MIFEPVSNQLRSLRMRTKLMRSLSAVIYLYE